MVLVGHCGSLGRGDMEGWSAIKFEREVVFKEDRGKEEERV
jgi:hypothetical protein